jgi:putative endonuclease
MKDTFAPAVYILASARNGTLYTGTTSNLIQRIAQHRSGHFDGFSDRYGTEILVWFEMHATMEHAILRKSGSRNGTGAVRNPGWRDLAADFGFEALR